MAKSPLPHPTKRPKDGEEWMWYAVVWGVAAPIVMGGLLGVLATYVVLSLTGLQPSDTTKGVVGVFGAASYYTFQGTFTWRSWFISHRNKTGNVSQRGRQNANNGGVNVKAGRNATINVAPSGHLSKGAVKAVVHRADWSVQTPPSNPTAVNVYARLSNRGGRVGLELAQMKFSSKEGAFEHLYTRGPNGTEGPPVLDTGDVRDFMFRFESKTKLDLTGRHGILELVWTDGQTTAANVDVRAT